MAEAEGLAVTLPGAVAGELAVPVAVAAGIVGKVGGQIARDVGVGCGGGLAVVAILIQPATPPPLGTAAGRRRRPLL